MTYILPFILVLGVVVFVHELGHFLAAKRLGIKVLKFQLGFNPTIFSIRRGDTEYSIGALPLGGYVKMAGENPDEDRQGHPEEFLSRTKWERFQVLVMGPVMNVVLAYLLTIVILYQGVRVPAYDDRPVDVGAVAANSAAAAADIRPGDRIVSVGSRTVETWEEFSLLTAGRANQDTDFGVMRDGTLRTVTFKVGAAKDSSWEIGDSGLLPDVHPVIPAVIAGEPAEKSGIKAGDIVTAVNGQRITLASELRRVIGASAGREITVSLLRDGTPVDVRATPVDRDNRGVLGIHLADETKEIKPSFVQALGLSAEKNVQYAGLIVTTLAGLFTRETSPKQLMGPIAIAQLSGESAAAGWLAILGLMASISLNLGLLNLMPIPMLDGGHITIMALEGVARRDFSMKVKEKMLFVGLVLLVSLMVTVIYNDLTRISWIERLMPWR
ncbi:MAG: RIP metalloprotease RseP [Acidimicrobiia bacterium]|nr:RIP metalloprotease RseP [Acidimicrobiia bacterium]